MKKSLVFLAAGLLSAAFQSCKSGGSDTVNLKMNFAPGTKYAYVMDMKMNMEQSAMGQSMKTDQNMIMESTYDVSAGEGTDKKFTISYDRIAMTMKNPMMNMEYDSKEGGKKDSLLNGLGMILNKPFTMTVTEKGEIKKIEGLDNIIQSVGTTGNPQDEAMRKQIASTFNDTAIRSMMQQSLNIYPDKTVKPGDTWTKTMSVNMGPIAMKIDNTYKLTSVTNGIAHIDVASKISSNGGSMQQGGQEIKVDLNGDSKGNMDVEVASGLVTDSKIKQTIKGTMSAMGMSIPMNVSSDIHITGKKK
jgi:hypothetical protein